MPNWRMKEEYLDGSYFDDSEPMSPEEEEEEKQRAKRYMKGQDDAFDNAARTRR